jgi:riboflavin biosynthesis pyrimidine reductase
MNRPYIIMHMLTSANSKITGDFLESEVGKIACNEYFKIHAELGADAFICGRITMNESFCKDYKPRLSAYKDEIAIREDFVAKKHDYYAVAIDPRGVLGWKSNIIKDDDAGYNNAHVIEVLTEEASDEYISYLRKKKISYIFCGKKKVGVKTLCQKLYKLFGIKTATLEGGGKTNAGFYNADVIDEISLVICPRVSDGINLFEGADFDPANYKMKQIKAREGQIIHAVHLRKQ